MAYLAADRNHYQGQTYVTGDVSLYASWADPILHGDRRTYEDVKVQYPPGSLPFMLLPDVGSPGPSGYLVRFVVEMVLVGLAAFGGLYLLARRYASAAGMWIWALALPALGPIVYDRVDLPPAAATIWGLAAFDSGALPAAGAWFGFATAAKLYPVLLVPQLVAAARRRAPVLAGFFVLVAAAVLPFVTELRSLWSSVLGYHSARGIQAESNWGLALLFASHAGHPTRVVYEFGSFNVLSPASEVLKRASEAASIAAVAGGAAVAWLRRAAGAGTLAGTMFGTLALVMSTGTVLSPQYLVWLMALGAVAATADRRFLLPAALIVPMGALSQEIYPFFYGDLLTAHPRELVILAVRNGLLLASAGWALAVALGTKTTKRSNPLDSCVVR